MRSHFGGKKYWPKVQSRFFPADFRAVLVFPFPVWNPKIRHGAFLVLPVVRNLRWCEGEGGRLTHLSWLASTPPPPTASKRPSGRHGGDQRPKGQRGNRTSGKIKRMLVSSVQLSASRNKTVRDKGNNDGEMNGKKKTNLRRLHF